MATGSVECTLLGNARRGVRVRIFILQRLQSPQKEV